MDTIPHKPDTCTFITEAKGKKRIFYKGQTVEDSGFEGLNNLRHTHPTPTVAV